MYRSALHESKQRMGFRRHPPFDTLRPSLRRLAELRFIYLVHWFKEGAVSELQAATNCWHVSYPGSSVYQPGYLPATLIVRQIPPKGSHNAAEFFPNTLRRWSFCTNLEQLWTLPVISSQGKLANVSLENASCTADRGGLGGVCLVGFYLSCEPDQ
jgi:hypothetical protein